MITDRSSIAQIQKRSSISQRASITKDAEQFKERNQDGWQDSSLVKNCHRCKTKFTMTKRKHHCRECGEVFCAKCSSYKVVIDGAFKRSCLNCYNKATKKEESVTLVIKSGDANPAIPDKAKAATTTKVENLPKSADVESEDGTLPSWAEAIFFIRKFGTDQSQTIQSIFPEECLTKEILDDIFASSMPRPLKANKTQEFKYMFRVRDKQLPGTMMRDGRNEPVGTAVTKTTVFYNCYVFYRQQIIYDADLATLGGSNNNLRSGTGSQLMRQSIVLISKWPFPQLAYRLLSKMDEAFYWNAETSRASVVVGGERSILNASAPEKEKDGWKDFDTEFNVDEQPPPVSPNTQAISNAATGVAVGGGGLGWDLTVDAVNNVLMVAFGQVSVWPPATPGTMVYMHFFGEMMQYNVANDMLSTYGANLSLVPTFSAINLVSLLGPLGLLQHIWTLWELLITGQDIVVVSTSPQQCSEVVLALGSLLLPLGKLGDIRPYIHDGDSDIGVIAATANAKYHRQLSNSNAKNDETRSKSMIIGITDMTCLRHLECFGAALFLTPPQTNVNNSDAVFTGLRTKNTATFHQFKGELVINTAAASDNVSRSSKPPQKQKKESYKKTHSYVDYCSSWIEENDGKCALVCRQEPTAFTIKKVLLKIKKLNPKDRNILGDKLLRDNLKELTLNFFKSTSTDANVDTKNILTSDIRASTIERAQLAEERIQIANEAKNAKNNSLFTMSDIGSWFYHLPGWCQDNVPTIILWILYLLTLLVCKYLGLPPVVLVGGALVVKVPEKAPRDFELLLRSIFPMWILYPSIARNARKSKEAASRNVANDTTTSSSTTATGTSADDSAPIQKVDFSGVWKRVKLVNYENILAAQGAGYVQRKMAASMQVIHTITMDTNLTVLRLQEKGGPIDVDNLYTIDGPEVTTNTMKNIFLDKVTWVGNKLKIRKLRMPEQAYELIMIRELIDGGKTIKLNVTYRDLKNPSTPEVVSDCFFEWVSASPNERPEGTGPTAGSNNNAKDTATAKEAAAPKSLKRDFSGVYNRTKTFNFEAFVGATGAGFMQRKLAATMALTHTITMDSNLQAFKIHEKGGPIDAEFTLTIDGEYVPATLNGKPFKHRMYWDGEAIVLSRRFEDQNYELLFSRTLEESADSTQIIVKSIHRDLTTGKETEATSWFTKTGPSKAPPPVPDLSLIKSNTNSTTDATAPSNNAPPTSHNDDEDFDNDDDDDEVAVAKMRSISSAKHNTSARLMAELQTKQIKAPIPNNSSNSNLAANNASQGSRPLFASTDSRSTSVGTSSRRPDFSGVWNRVNNSNLDSKLAAKMSLTHVISVNMNMNTLRIREISAGRAVEDLKLQLDVDYVHTTVNKKSYRTKCYYEGSSLVVSRINDAENIEYTIKRDLEEEGTVIRLVTTQTNILTGEESESMMLFQLDTAKGVKK